MTGHSERARGIARRIGSALLCLTFALAALYFALNTLCAIINFGWREPMFDQWSEYETLLGLPFPQNVLQQVAGHRPILPNLVRVAEIRWFGADQSLQLVVGSLCAFLSAAILAGAAYGERKLPPVARWAGVMLSIITCPNPEHDTCVAPSIRRAKSYVTFFDRIDFSIELMIRSAALVQPMRSAIAC